MASYTAWATIGTKMFPEYSSRPWKNTPLTVAVTKYARVAACSDCRRAAKHKRTPNKRVYDLGSGRGITKAYSLLWSVDHCQGIRSITVETEQRPSPF